MSSDSVNREEPHDPVEAVERVYRLLRANTRGDLRFDEHMRPIKYVIAPSGRLVAPAMVAMLTAVDTVLFVPEAADGALECQVTLEQFDERGPDGALADRWRIHHGDPPDVNWAFVDVDAAKVDGLVVDGDALARPNPLAEAEAPLCREMNRSRGADLKALCLHYAKVEVEAPVMVAIDSLGLDVRGRFDVFRIEAAEPIDGAEDARRVIDEMVEVATAAAPPGES